MKPSFENIKKYLIPMTDFRLSWRFTEEEFDKLPDNHLGLINPLNQEGAMFLDNYISKVSLHANVPFKKDFFITIDKARILSNNQKQIKKWLFERGFPFEREVYLSWDNETAAIVPWKILIKYFESFAYGGSDDLTVFDESLNWAILFFHEGEIYFGTNEKFKPSMDFKEHEFIY